MTRGDEWRGEADHVVSDPELITAVRAGDRSAFGELYRRHVGPASTLARQFARTPAEADDLVSEAFARVLDQLLTGHGPDTAFRAYLFTSLRNTAYDRTRKDRRLQFTDDMTGHDQAVVGDDPVVARMENGLVAAAFARLPERWQAVLWHTQVEGESPAAVGELLGMAPGAVSSLAFRAREGLREAYLQAHLADTAGETCRTTVERLGAWTRGGLSKREKAQVDAHLAGCDRCRTLAAELHEVNTGLRALLAPVLLGAAAVGYLATLGPVAPMAAGLLGAVAPAGMVGGAMTGTGSGGAVSGGSAGAVSAGATGTAATGTSAGAAATGTTAGAAATGTAAGTTAGAAAGTTATAGTLGAAGTVTGTGSLGAAAAGAASGAATGVTGSAVGLSAGAAHLVGATGVVATSTVAGVGAGAGVATAGVLGATAGAGAATAGAAAVGGAVVGGAALAGTAAAGAAVAGASLATTGLLAVGTAAAAAAVTGSVIALSDVAPATTVDTAAATTISAAPTSASSALPDANTGSYQLQVDPSLLPSTDAAATPDATPAATPSPSATAPAPSDELAAGPVGAPSTGLPEAADGTGTTDLNGLLAPITVPSVPPIQPIPVITPLNIPPVPSTPAIVPAPPVTTTEQVPTSPAPVTSTPPSDPATTPPPTPPSETPTSTPTPTPETTQDPTPPSSDSSTPPPDTGGSSTVASTEPPSGESTAPSTAATTSDPETSNPQPPPPAPVLPDVEAPTTPVVLTAGTTATVTVDLVNPGTDGAATAATTGALQAPAGLALAGVEITRLGADGVSTPVSTTTCTDPARCAVELPAIGAGERLRLDVAIGVAADAPGSSALTVAVADRSTAVPVTVLAPPPATPQATLGLGDPDGLVAGVSATATVTVDGPGPIILDLRGDDLWITGYPDGCRVDGDRLTCPGPSIEGLTVLPRPGTAGPVRLSVTVDGRPATVTGPEGAALTVTPRPAGAPVSVTGPFGATAVAGSGDPSGSALTVPTGATVFWAELTWTSTSTAGPAESTSAGRAAGPAAVDLTRGDRTTRVDGVVPTNAPADGIGVHTADVTGLLAGAGPADVAVTPVGDAPADGWGWVLTVVWSVPDAATTSVTSAGALATPLTDPVAVLRAPAGAGPVIGGWATVWRSDPSATVSVRPPGCAPVDVTSGAATAIVAFGACPPAADGFGGPQDPADELTVSASTPADGRRAWAGPALIIRSAG